MTGLSVRGGPSPPVSGAARVIVLVSLVCLLLVVAVAVFSPGAEDDPTPATWNTGKAGAKAALLLLGSLGYHAAASDRPLAELSSLPDAAHTTLILAEPQLPADDLKADRAALGAFLKHGGSVLATGLAGAALLDRSEVHASTRMFQSLCLTVPEGRSPMARAGSVPIAVPVSWTGEPSTSALVAQRCGDEAVVVRWRVGTGTATWWSSATPLGNQGLHNDASLRLLLASLAPFSDSTRARRRTILFDESLHGVDAARETSPLQGLPLPMLLGQAALVAALLLFSRSRRHGPIRSPAGAAARTSPLEFAWSMGALYSRAGAHSAPVEAAERRLLRVLAIAGGLPQSVLTAGPAAIGTALRDRFGEQEAWGILERDLARAAHAAEAKSSPADTLSLVRALDAHAVALPRQISSQRSMQSAVTQERTTA